MAHKNDEQKLVDDIIALAVRTAFLLLQFVICDVIVAISIAAAIAAIYRVIIYQPDDIFATFLAIAVMIYFAVCTFYNAIGTIRGIYICTENGAMIFRGKPMYYPIYITAMLLSIANNTIGNTVIVIADIAIIIAIMIHADAIEWVFIALAYASILVAMLINAIAYVLGFILRYALSSKGRSFIRAVFANYGPRATWWLLGSPCRIRKNKRSSARSKASSLTPNS